MIILKFDKITWTFLESFNGLSRSANEIQQWQQSFGLGFLDGEYVIVEAPFFYPNLYKDNLELET